MAAEDGLKAQKLLAQGSALGNVGKKQSRPERAKALNTRSFCPFRATFLRNNLFPAMRKRSRNDGYLIILLYLCKQK